MKKSSKTTTKHTVSNESSVNNVNTVISIKNSGRHAERLSAVAVGYAAAVTKGTSVGAKKGWLIGWNYDQN